MWSESGVPSESVLPSGRTWTTTSAVAVPPAVTAATSASARCWASDAPAGARDAITCWSITAPTTPAAAGVSRAVMVTMPSGSVRRLTDLASNWRRAISSASSWRWDHAATATPRRPAGVTAASATSSAALRSVSWAARTRAFA